MKPEIKEMWVAALRSGEYYQTTGSLYRSGEYCCLGVLCDLHAKTTGAGKWNLTQYKGDDDILPESFLLPLSVVLWSGVEDRNPTVIYGNGRAELSNLNDGLGVGEEVPRHSFKQIADLIEQNL